MGRAPGGAPPPPAPPAWWRAPAGAGPVRESWEVRPSCGKAACAAPSAYVSPLILQTLSTCTRASRVFTKVQVTFLSSATATVTEPSARSTLTGVTGVPPVWLIAAWVQVTLARFQPGTGVSRTVTLPGATREWVSFDSVGSESSSSQVSLLAFGAVIVNWKSCALSGRASLITVILPASTAVVFIWLVWVPTLPQLRLVSPRW